MALAFGKRKKEDQIGQFLGGIMDSQDSDIVVVRGKDCELLYANSAAKRRMSDLMQSEATCRNGYSHLFPRLCDECPLYNNGSIEESFTFDTENEEGRLFSVHGNKLIWSDDQPALMLSLRDVDDERNAKQKLYNLAYIDQLTGVPNRQRLREDFDEVAKDIEEDRCCGIISIFDLDNFKAINDTYGHNTGDIMLRRLTEHLSGDSNFKGHIYRLGGDEFVLFYAAPIGQHRTYDDYKKYYTEMLQKALLSYTMPNIEKSCTISMGVAFFPNHGISYSELLRKADIALYQAKEGGRNQMAFFEDRYDTAKKFKDLYINIQPILTSSSRTFGYEMIDRGNEDQNDDQAFNLSEFDRTMDALGLGDIENDSRYFITFTNQLLSRSVLNNLPKSKFIIQIHDTPDISARQMEKYQQLFDAGYSIAFVDIQGPPDNNEVMRIADYCKFDNAMVDAATQREIIARYPGNKFIATGVDSRTRFDDAKRLGFKLYQGFYFEQPAVVKKTKDIDPLKVNYFRLLQLTSTEDYVDFKEISAVIGSDVALSYKLLRLLNSAAVGLRNKISSIDMAVAYLGEENLKKWIGMLALRGIASDKPLELVRISLIRAQFGELLSSHFTPRRDPRHVFLVGMFSLLHVALEKTREELFEEIPVSDDIRLSLMTRDGPHSDLIAFYTNYEYANWDEITQFGRTHNLSDKLINDSYIAAVKWYNDLSAEDLD